MKRSEFMAKRRAHWRVGAEIGANRGMWDESRAAECDALAAEEAGVTWDPEEPVVLWEARWRNPAAEKEELRQILADGSWRVDGFSWPVENESPELAELVRRLLAERELSIAIEGQRTEIKEALADGRLKQATVPGPLPWEGEREDATLDLDFEGPIIPRRMTKHPAFKAVWSVIDGWESPVFTGSHVLEVLRALRDAGVVILATK